MEEYMLPCMSKSLLGIECMGCGMQRSLVLISRGDFVAAFEMFPAIYTSILFILFLALHLIDTKRAYHKIVISFAIVNAVIMIISYFYKLTHY